MITMWRIIYKKRAIIVTFILTLSFIHCIFGLCSPSFSATTPKSENILSEKSGCSNEGMPDFVIEDIFLWPSNTPDEYNFEYSLRNIGDSAIYHFDIEINVKIIWIIFGKIPILTISSSTDTIHIDALIPEKKINLTLASCEKLPKFGSYRFSLKVNPNLKIDESNYDNNKYSEDWKVFFGQWKEIG